MSEPFEECPDCGVKLPTYADDARPQHPYIGASASCWELFTNLWSANEPSLAPMPLNGLILDGYCVQHHGTESPAAIQSVAVHLLALYGVLRRGVPPERAQWIRERAVRPMKIHRHKRWHWLEPLDQSSLLTVQDIVEPTDPASRATIAQGYVTGVADLWLSEYEADALDWFDRFITN